MNLDFCTKFRGLPLLRGAFKVMCYTASPLAGGFQTNLSLLCAKGGGAALAVTEELSVHTADLLILQNDRITIPQSLSRQLPLHKGAL